MDESTEWFGFRLPFLPDFLSDHTLLGQEPDTRLPEHCRRWAQFVGGLWRDKEEVTYVLRFDWQPNAGMSGQSCTERRRDGCVQVLLLGKLQKSEAGAEIFVNDLETWLRTFGLEPERLLSLQARTLSSSLSSRFAGETATCYEVRQEDYRVTYKQENLAFEIPEEFQILTSEKAIVPASRPPNFSSGEPPRAKIKEMYALQPWWGPGGSFLSPLDTMTAQEVDASLSILLRPTQLQSEENRLLSAIAREGESLAQQATVQKSGIGGLQTQASQSRTDPNVRWAARLYSANLRRLSHPFLCAAYCFSARQSVAWQIAQSVAITIREEMPFENALGETEPLPSGAKVVSLSNRLALKICAELEFDCTGETKTRASELPSMSLARLPYLINARGATSVFRLPVSINGGVPGIEVRQRPPDFHPGPRLKLKPEGHIELGTFHAGGLSSLPVEAFRKHALVTGFTGSGKTTTVLNLLHQFWLEHSIPFLVIESAKKEYRGLLANERFKDRESGLLVYTLGNETCAPFRLNPFELLPGMRVEAHTSRLQACFEAALPPLPFLPSILAESLERLYKRFWWTLTDTHVPATRAARRFPRMIDFYNVVEQVASERKYAGEARSNVIAATTGRIKQLLIGSLGLMFGDEKSISLDLLYRRPVILELNDLNLQDKALVMMFLLTQLREYRELAPSQKLSHVTIIEEAHNVLGQVESHGTGEGAGADTRAKSVEAFCNMLAEVRALGEGLIIADQSPNKLAPDALRNTNVQIAHQLRDANDRESIANALIMDEEQRDFLGKLVPGQAALFYTGLQRATFISGTNYYQRADAAFDEFLSDTVVRFHMDHLTSGYRKLLTPFSSCDHCASQCVPREQVLGLIADRVLEREVHETFKIADSRKPGEGSAMVTFRKLVALSGEAARAVCHPASVDSAWCFFLHHADRHHAGDADAFERAQRLLFETYYRAWSTGDAQ